jgi:hypothetical protein
VRQLLEPFAHRAWKPPSSSSIAEEERLVSIHARCSLRSLRLLVSRCLPHSLAGSLALPGQRRVSLAQQGGVRVRRSRQFMEPLAHRAWKPPTSSSIAEEEHLVSLVLSTVARDFRRSQL